MLKSPPPAKEKTAPRNISKTSFNNKSIEKINLYHIFNNPLDKAALPNKSNHLDTPTVVYTLTNTTGSKIFIFNKFVNNLDVKALLENYSASPCKCTGFPFIDKIDNHIITGNLKFISCVMTIFSLLKSINYCNIS